MSPLSKIHLHPKMTISRIKQFDYHPIIKNAITMYFDFRQRPHFFIKGFD